MNIILTKVSFKSNKKNLLTGILIGNNQSSKDSAALIVCHGFSGTKEGGGKAISMAKYFSSHNITTLLFDFSGNGESDGKFEDITLSGQIQDLNVAINFIKDLGFNKIFVMGRSFGGTTAICYTGYHKPHYVKGVICVNSVARPYELFSKVRTKRDGDKVVLKADEKQVIIKNDFFEDLKKWDILSLAKKISPIPLLIIQGDRDEVVDPKEAQMLYNSARDPKELKIIKGGDHTFTDNYKPMWEATLKFILKLSN
ncbi:alpha/beta hydrolase [Desulfothermus naphthae]